MISHNDVVVNVIVTWYDAILSRTDIQKGEAAMERLG